MLLRHSASKNLVGGIPDFLGIFKIMLLVNAGTLHPSWKIMRHFLHCDSVLTKTCNAANKFGFGSKLRLGLSTKWNI